MKRKAYLVILGLTAVLFNGCNHPSSAIENTEAYISSVEKWKKDRLDGLKGQAGWLNLAGIYWLKEGEQRIGSDPSNDHVFPEKAAPFIGTLTLDNESILLKVNDQAELFYQGERIHELALSYDSSGKPSYITHGDFAWYIMKRHTSLAIRLRDYKNPAIEELEHIPAYPIDPDYVVEAQLIPFEEVKTITVPTPFQDYTQDYKCPGELRFRLKGKELTLLPFISGDKYFIILSDETSGIETYGGGRFMYTSPDSNGRIVLDFNKAYNPPCAITPFAACPMPPRENFLPLRVEAGEKALATH